jgi:hypothetical protein
LQKLAEQAGRVEDEEETRYRCPRCNDSSWIIERGKHEAIRCACFKQQAEQHAEHQRRVKGKDELNLCSIALCDFAAGRPSNRGRFDREWVDRDGYVIGLQAHPDQKIGLPTPADMDLIVGLQQLTKQWNAREHVPFKPPQLLDILRRERRRGSAYRDTRNGFKRLAALFIERYSGWYDKEQKKVTTVGGFHILDSYNWPTRKDLEKGANPQCWFTWGEAILKSMRDGAWKNLNLEVYWSIESPIARFVYRYADRELYWTERPTVRTEHLYCNILGLKWNGNSPAMMVMVLKSHLAELPVKAGIGVKIGPEFVEFWRLSSKLLKP